MFTSLPICTSVPPPPIPSFNGNVPVNNSGYNGNMVGSYPPPYGNNPYFPNCNTTLTNIRPPGFNTINYSGNIRPPLPMGDSNSVGPMNCYSNNHFVNTPSNFPPFPSNFTHPPGTFTNPSFQNNPGPFPNYSMFPPPNNLFTRPPPPITTASSSNGTYLNSRNVHCTTNSPRQFNKYGSKFNEEKPMPFRCECCDRGFMFKNKYDEHVLQHITCGIENCKFTAHPKIIEKHILMQHRTGLFNRIVKGNTPEEIDKWICERKKHFPTKRKIEEKKAQQEEMQKRGERYTEQKRTFSNRNSRMQGRQNRFHNNFNHRGQPIRGKKTFNKALNDTDSATEQTVDPKPIKKKIFSNINEEEDDCVHRNLPPFRGTVYYLENNDNNAEWTEENHLSVTDNVNDVPSTNYFFDECDSDTVDECSTLSPMKQSECSVESKVGSITTKPGETITQESSADRRSPVTENEKSINNSLSSSLDLIKGYDFSDEEDNEKNEQQNAIDNATNVVAENSDDSGPEEYSSKNPVPPSITENMISATKYDVEPESCSETLSKNQARKRKKRREKKEDEESKGEEDKQPLPPVIKYKRFRPPTLLEKLLAPEIRHERNVILQCVRYIVENEYFGVGQRKMPIS